MSFETPIKEDPGKWRHSYGNYLKGGGLFSMLNKEEREFTTEGLIFQITQDRIAARRELVSSPDSSNLPPVITMDFGSTNAHTMVRLAKQFEREIRAGELVIVCTNLEDFKPNEEADRRKYDGSVKLSVADYNNQEISDYYLFVNLITWIKGEAKDIQSLTVTDMTSKEWPLLGNVALINEFYVLMHVDDEIEVVRILRSLLDNYGVLVFDSNAENEGLSSLPTWFMTDIIANDDRFLFSYFRSIQDKLFEVLDFKIALLTQEMSMVDDDYVKRRNEGMFVESTKEEFLEDLQDQINRFEDMRQFVLSLPLD